MLRIESINAMLLEEGPPPRTSPRQSTQNVKHWTSTTTEKFGETGEKGREGELFVLGAIASWGWFVWDMEKDRDAQLAGHDIRFQNPDWHNKYSADVKNNLDKFGAFYVNPVEWMHPKKTNDRFWHVNTETGWMVWYSRYDMQDYIRKNNKTEGFWVRRKDKMPFKMTWRRCEV
jgi:hypothetical protein